jgi:hypothetical protein
MFMHQIISLELSTCAVNRSISSTSTAALAISICISAAAVQMSTPSTGSSTWTDVLEQQRREWQASVHSKVLHATLASDKLGLNTKLDALDAALDSGETILIEPRLLEPHGRTIFMSAVDIWWHSTHALNDSWNKNKPTFDQARMIRQIGKLQPLMTKENINLVDMTNSSFLHVCAYMQCQTEVTHPFYTFLRHALTIGADVHAINKEQRTPLQETLQCKHRSAYVSPTMQILLEFGANPSEIIAQIEHARRTRG